MSLNGLDDAKVTQAYQGALAEGGGWFLLKYASRDAVEVLARGTGGAAEARGAVAQYEESSPLYGFLLYRRRKILIKYLPEGTSRLLQARVAVHFTAVSEKFTPHDTTVSIASADELSDAALAAACSLHTAAPSSCSSSGSSRRKLDEITEDAEEGQATEDDNASPARPATAASLKPAIAGPTVDTKTAAQAVEPSTPPDPPKDAPAPEKPEPAEEAKPTAPTVTADSAPEEKSEPKASDYRQSLKVYDDLFRDGPDPRFSSQTARPAMSDLYADLYAQYKPKVKLGPRPKQSLDVNRPHTSGTGSQNASRPVSSLPPGIRVANRKAIEPKRPKSRETSAVPSIAFPPPPPVPAIPELPQISIMHAPKSPASVRSMPVHSLSSLNPKSPGITPEKQRLMRALELRKKQLKAKQEITQKKVESVSDETTTVTEEDVKSGGSLAMDPSSLDTVKEDASAATGSKEEATTPDEEDVPPSKLDDVASNEVKSPSATEDPKVDMLGSQTEGDDHASASSPTSAQTQGSSGAPSTRPSSVSEDENMLSEQMKAEETKLTPNEVADKSDELQNEDEKESIESTPTIVPESSTPIPSVEVALQPDEPESLLQPFASDDVLTRRSKRESMVLMPHSGQDDARSRRKSKRESMIFLPSAETSHLGDFTDNKRDKRESMIFLTPEKSSSPAPKDKVDPVQIHLGAENSEAEYLSDDSFMEELQSAKVEQAQPISVSKSPITPFFPRKSSLSGVPIPERSTSQPYPKPGRLSPEQLMGRKASGPWPLHANSDTVVVAKKINVSSGISQRIKALAEKSNRESTGSVSPSGTPDASASIVAQRKSSFFSTPPSGNSPNGKPINRLSHASFASLHTTPDRQSVLPSPPSREGTPMSTVYNVKPGIEKPESVQVTARIVRDSRTQRPTLTMPTEHTPLELHQSPIIIDHRKLTQPSPGSKSPVKSIGPKLEPTSPRPPSSSHSREPSTSASALPRSSSESSWRSFGRRLSESRPGSAPLRSQSTHSFESGEEKRDEKKEKKDSRTSKLFKRMSSISSISRKNPGSTAVLEEEDRPATSLPSLREPPPSVQVGDLNVQFPDTLLWKRRWVEIDASGNLVLSLSRSNEQSKGITKRFHLTEFRTPYAPDQDQQELPNSVILDFVDGRTLQCACETYLAQVQVLQILREAHDAWIAYNQGQ